MARPKKEVTAAPDQEKKRRGRPKNQNYLSYEEARAVIREELIPSMSKYKEWWNREKPKTIPRFPYRVYIDEWVSWNDFLGTDNKFNDRSGRSWRQYDEGAMWAHSLKLKSSDEWFEYCKTNELPADIPTRPDLVYTNKWTSWNHWLGNKTTQAIEAKQQAQNIQVYYIIHEKDVPGNVFTFGVEPNGISALKERWEMKQFDVLKLFWYDPSRSAIAKQIVETFSTPYMGMDRQRIVPNVWEIVYHLQMQFEMIRNVG